MRYRRLGKTGYKVSEIGFGAWAIGGSWGPVDDDQSLEALHAAADAGVTFFDTADVYGDGHSERLLARFRAERDEEIVIATKVGRRAPLDVREYTPDNLFEWIDRSRENLGTERLDLVQLHCPPWEVYYTPEVFEALDELVAASVINAYGVSVERVEEALKAVEYPHLGSVQIVFNPFRQRPADLFLARAKERDVGVIARVPLASGLLTGKFTEATSFPEDDHRTFNVEGAAFDVGETFSGVDFETGVQAAAQLADRVPEGATLPQVTLRWILMHEGVSTTIPGAKTPEQARDNAAASLMPALDEEFQDVVRWLYEERIAPQVHHRW
ncbi:aldo/keto reductase [Egibacter rhizosphaerae]|uniref:Aldo/keto reductase n=1 Tax=Egibacter rhizosphaerae TaxID=1670831 RepID=A0A411YIM6_9ACTN|nr:aldo/keto reductase [Egibacter rhizosphaerae]QBI20979.1 aldo/keto reductase [Egibacter rhizosphaerae]